MNAKNNRKQRLAHIGKLPSTCLEAEADLHKDDVIYSIMKSMDTFRNSEKNIITYQQLQEFRSQKKTSISNASMCDGKQQNAKLSRKLIPEKVFPLMAKCQRNMKYLKKNMCIPKPRAHVGHVPKPPKPIIKKLNVSNYLSDLPNKKIGRLKEHRKVPKNKDTRSRDQNKDDTRLREKNKDDSRLHDKNKDVTRSRDRSKDNRSRDRNNRPENVTSNAVETSTRNFRDEAVNNASSTESDTAFESFLHKQSRKKKNPEKETRKIKRKRCISPVSGTSSDSDTSLSLHKDKACSKMKKRQRQKRKPSQGAHRNISKVTVRNLSDSSVDSIESKLKESSNNSMIGVNSNYKSETNWKSKSKQSVDKFHKSSSIDRCSESEINVSRSEDEAFMNYQSCDDTLNHYDSSDCIDDGDALCQEINKRSLDNDSRNVLPNNIFEKERVPAADIENMIYASTLDCTNTSDSENIDSKLHSWCYVLLERHPVLEQRVCRKESACPLLNNLKDDCAVPSQQTNAQNTVLVYDLQSSQENSDLNFHNRSRKSQSTMSSQDISNSSVLCIQPELDESASVSGKPSLSYGENSGGSLYRRTNHTSQPTNYQNVTVACREGNFCSAELSNEPNIVASLAEPFTSDDECVIICEKTEIDRGTQTIDSVRVSESPLLQNKQKQSFTNITPQILSVVSLATDSELIQSSEDNKHSKSEAHINDTGMDSITNESDDSDIEIITDFNISDKNSFIEKVPLLKENAEGDLLNTDTTNEHDCIIIHTISHKNDSGIHDKNKNSLGENPVQDSHKEQLTCITPMAAEGSVDAEPACEISNHFAQADKIALRSEQKTEIENGTGKNPDLTENSKIFEILKQIDFDNIKKVLNQSTVDTETCGFNSSTDQNFAIVKKDDISKNSLNVNPSFEVSSGSSNKEIDNEIIILSQSGGTNPIDNEINSELSTIEPNYLQNRGEREGNYANAAILGKRLDIDGLKVISENLPLQGKHIVFKDNEVISGDLSLQNCNVSAHTPEQEVVGLPRGNIDVPNNLPVRTHDPAPCSMTKKPLMHPSASPVNLPPKCTEQVLFPLPTTFYGSNSKEECETLGTNNTSKSKKSLILHNFKNKVDHVHQDLKSQKGHLLPIRESFKCKRDNESPSDELDISAASAIRDLDLHQQKRKIAPLLDLYKAEFKKYMEIKCTEKNVSAGLKLLEDKQAKILAHISTSINNFTQHDPCFSKIAKRFGDQMFQVKSPMEFRDSRLNIIHEVKAVPKSSSSLDTESNSDVKIFHPSVVRSAQEMVTTHSAQPSRVEQEVYRHLINTKCAECGRQALAACQGCTKVYYCSSECGEKFWFKGHSETCTR